MKLIVPLFAVGFLFAVGQALTCYKCKIGIFNLCYTTQTTCSNGEYCFSGVGKAAGFLDIKQKGCLAVALCNLTSDTSFPENSNTTIYKMTKTCCNTDLCNVAPGLPSTTGLSLALASISALFAANYMV